MTSLQDLLSKAKQRYSRNDSATRLSKGKNKVRILPGWRNGDPQFWHDFGQHWVKDTDGSVKAVVVCDAKTFDKECELCNMVEMGLNSLPEGSVEHRALQEAKATGRVLLNVLMLDSEDPKTPKVLEVPPTVFGGNKGVGGIISLFEEYPDLIDPEKGNDIIIEKTGSGIDTRYGVMVANSKTKVSKDILEKLNNLDDFVNQTNTQRLLAAKSQFAALGVTSASTLAIADTRTIEDDDQMSAVAENAIDEAFSSESSKEEKQEEKPQSEDWDEILKNL